MLVLNSSVRCKPLDSSDLVGEPLIHGILGRFDWQLAHKVDRTGKAIQSTVQPVGPIDPIWFLKH